MSETFDDELAEFFNKNGWNSWHTGGGCWAWHKRLNANEYLLITFDECTLGSWAERETPNWTVGRYLENEQDQGWICATDLTLAKAFEAQLPQPKNGDEIIQ